MKTYKVLAKRWARGWELRIDDVGVTRSHSLRDAEAMARGCIALDTGTPAESFAVEIIPRIGGGLDEKTQAAREAVRAADRALQDAAAQSRSAAHELQQAGLSGRDIARMLNVSPQRVSELLGTGV
jgi:DNA-directed RNA polymerase specialized sigma24 family protein